jgi:polysaccharide deacetylase 2 family uncharacterized protein YibQ
MAKKRTKAKPKPKTKRRRAKSNTRASDFTLQVIKIIGGLTVLILLVVSAALLANFFLQRPLQPERPTHRTMPPVPAQAKPAYEVFPPKAVPSKPLARLPVLPGDQPPLVAIILDDIGYDRQMAAQFLELDAPLTLSVLPYGPFSQQLAAQARAMGHEIMLHLPMEPNEYPQVNPGPGALLSHMSPDEMIAQLQADLLQFPGLKGVNNHMGSAMSTSPERMRQIFSILKKRGLYYVDSRTTAETVARPSAHLLQLPFAERDIFIDHFEDAGFIQGQLKKLIQRARRQGYAVGIAHPHVVTLTVLKQFLPQLKTQVELVPASMVIESVMLAQADKIQTSN